MTPHIWFITLTRHILASTLTKPLLAPAITVWLGIIRLFIVPMLLVASYVHANIPPHSPWPGGLAVLYINAKNPTPTLRFNDKPAVTIKQQGDWYGIIPLPLATPPGWHTAQVEITQNDGPKVYPLPFEVQPKSYQEQHLTIKNTGKVNLSQESLDRHYQERKKVNQVYKIHTPTVPDFVFIKPSEGPFSSAFGLKRFYNGQPRAPHSGLDIAAPEGTPVYATAPGQVVYVEDLFFSGNSIFIHHGQGVVSFYAHLKDTLVKEGDELLKGDVIGTVGKTGRVTGPHLHWAVYFSGTPVNPALFLSNRLRPHNT